MFDDDVMFKIPFLCAKLLFIRSYFRILKVLLF
jgi:hypothetical protein